MLRPTFDGVIIIDNTTCHLSKAECAVSFCVTAITAACPPPLKQVSLFIVICLMKQVILITYNQILFQQFHSTVPFNRPPPKLIIKNTTVDATR